MSEMFCFQCEQTAKGSGCTTLGICGKDAETARRQDELTGALVGLARAAEGKTTGRETDELVMRSMFATLTNVNFDAGAIRQFKNRVEARKKELGGGRDMPAEEIFSGEEDSVSLRSTFLIGLRGMAAYLLHAYRLGKESPELMAFIYRGLREVGSQHTVEEWLSLLMEVGQMNLKTMALLDEANTSTFGHPEPTKVSMEVEKGPFIVITGHDLLDLKQLLEQTERKGVNVYTHGEMLPAHAYPELKKYPHLRGNYGTAWQNQQKEFDALPAPIVFTTNCLMPPKKSYIDNVYTTDFMGYPGVKKITEKDGVKDFGPVIERAVELGGWPENKQFTGINGGRELTTGFARNAVMNVAGPVIEAVKGGDIKHFFLVGGCDGAKGGRNYYTDFVKQTPEDSVILTLACGKYRFNDLNIGQIGGIPRMLDMGQCNDAYSAIQVAVALADAFGCSVNELPLTLVLSWYEQKAVSILLTLLSLGIKNIHIGPSLPAFISPTVLGVLVDKFGLKPVTTPRQDIEEILGQAG